jgi:signal peptidase I
MLFYRGTSMLPTFRPGDLVRFVSPRVRPLRAGDVIIYPDPYAEGCDRPLVIHRIVAEEDGRIRTRGDNNTKRDPYRVAFETIVGRAVARVPVGTADERTVAGGRTGLLRARMLWLRRIAVRMVRVPLHRPYRAVADRTCRRMPPAVQSKVFQFQRSGVGSFHMTLFGRPVGRLLPGGQWSIRPPFRLFIDPTRLPAAPAWNCNPQPLEDSNHG